MTKAMRKITAILLSVLLCCSAVTSLPVTAFAAETKADSAVAAGGSADYYLDWSLDEDGNFSIYKKENVDGVVSMRHSIYNDPNFNNYYYPWEEYRSNIKHIYIGSSISNICSNAFSSCINLISVTIPDSVTKIEDGAFYNCPSLESIKIDANNSVYDSRNNCDAIIRTNTNTLLFGCKNTRIPNGVTGIGEKAFYNCSGLTSVTIPDSVTYIKEEAFYGCTGSTKLMISKNVKSIGRKAFTGCKVLTSVNISDSETSIGEEAFSGCTGLTSVTIPDSVTSIGRYAFSNCTGLTSITIPKNVTSIDSYAFSGCTGLTSVTFLPDNINSDNSSSYSFNIFEKCSGIKRITIASSNGLFKLDFPNDIQAEVVILEGTESIGDCAFDGYNNLTSVTIPDSVKSIGYRAFLFCKGLTSVTIPKNVTSIDKEAFSYCTGLTSIKVNAGNKVYDSRNDCNALIETKTNTLLLGCKNTSIPNSVTSIGVSAFYNCTGLTSVTIPDSVTSIGTCAFTGCTGLTSVTIPNSVTSIGDYAFNDCAGLRSITIPDSVTSIGSRAFGWYESHFSDIYGNEGIRTVKIPGFFINGYENSEAQRYAENESFMFNIITAPATQPTTEEKPVEKTDEKTGVAVVIEDTAEMSGIELQVEDVTAEENPNLALLLTKGQTAAKIYNISLKKNGETVQPSGNVTVKIPCDNEKAKVYRAEADNSLTDMNAIYENEHLVFTTEHFSLYVVTEPKMVIPGDVNGDDKVNGADAGLLNRYTSGWEGYADKIKDMDAADLNRDGKVNGADAGILNRYTSGWTGYDKYIQTVTK